MKQFGGLRPSTTSASRSVRWQIVGLIGPNGAGKVHHLQPRYRRAGPDIGHRQFRGEVISGPPSRDIAQRGMGRTFQHVKDDSRHDRVRKRGPVPTCAAPAAHCRLCCGWNHEEENRLMREAACQLERIGMADHMHDLGQSQPAAPDGNSPAPLCSDPAPAAAGRVRRRSAPQRKGPKERCCASCAARA